MQGVAEVLPFLNTGVGGAVAVVIILLWRAERKDSREREQKTREQADKMYGELALNFRKIVEENTEAIALLRSTLERGVTDCPYTYDARHRSSGG